MEFPLTPRDISDEIRISIQKEHDAYSQRYEQLCSILKKANPEIILEGIVQVFEKSSEAGRHYAEQDFAGKLLKDLEPEGSIELNEILTRTLNNFNLSVYEFPLFLSKKYGEEKLLKELSSIETMDNPEINKSIEAFKYWIKVKKS